MKIEHFAPRSTAPDRVFDWANLHGSCSGGEGLPPRLQTCDTRKGDRSCALDPLSIRDEDFTYDGAGRIRHVAAQQELDETLNLNARNLVRARKGRWVGYAQGFERRNKRWTRRSLEKELQRLDPENGPLDEFAGMYSSWLRRKLRRQG